MAGKPVTNAMLGALQKRAHAEIGEDATALDYVAGWLADGRTIVALAVELNVSYALITATLRRAYGAELVSNTLREAREYGAHALAEQALEIADTATPADAQVARLRIGARQWTAERYNARELAAKGQSVAVQVNVGDLMLDALRQPAPVRPAIATAIVEPAKHLTDGKSTAYDTGSIGL